jgi:hypothetical protein
VPLPILLKDRDAVFYVSPSILLEDNEALS